jgi:hypothetical protein
VQVAQREVGQVVRPLVGAGKIRRQGRVPRDAVQGPAVRGEREQRRLGVVEHLEPLRIGQPRRDGRLVARVERDGVEPGGRPVPGGDRDAGQ